MKQELIYFKKEENLLGTPKGKDSSFLLFELKRKKKGRKFAWYS
jgi:hypothetical protein